MSDQTNPSAHFFAVTPSDTADLAVPARALYVGTGGDVTIRGLGSATAILFSNVPDASLLPIRVSRVMATGTDAEGIVALV